MIRSQQRCAQLAPFTLCRQILRGASRSPQNNNQALRKPNLREEETQSMKDEDDHVSQIERSVREEGGKLDVSTQKFDSASAHSPPGDVGFWDSERGLQIKEQTMTAVGRVLRMWVTKERYDNLYEGALTREITKIKKFNEGDDLTLQKHGPEWAFGQIVFNLGGAVKLLYDDRWVEDPRCLRTPKRRDFKIEGLDLRKSAINSYGLNYLAGVEHIRYMNVGDAKQFDNHALAALHPLSDSLEFLDLSGTAVNERGLGYLRLFPKLRFLNLSRLHNFRDLEGLLPLIEEILPEHCCVVTDDYEPADSYGCHIPYRSPINPKKDLPVPKTDKNIGNLLMYNEGTGMEVDLYRHDTIHELWRTPEIGPFRNFRLNGQQHLDNSRLHKLVKYIVKAENYRPLI